MALWQGLVLLNRRLWVITETMAKDNAIIKIASAERPPYPIAKEKSTVMSAKPGLPAYLRNTRRVVTMALPESVWMEALWGNMIKQRREQSRRRQVCNTGGTFNLLLSVIDINVRKNSTRISYTAFIPEIYHIFRKTEKKTCKNTGCLYTESMNITPLQRNCIVLAVLFCTGILVAQQGESAMPTNVDQQYEFVNQELRDIVYILSLRSGFPLICDDTVTGTGSFLYHPVVLRDAGGGGMNIPLMPSLRQTAFM